MQDQQHYLLNVLELLEGTRIDWKSLDSRSIEIFSSLLLPFARVDIQSISNHCEASSNFCLHSSMMSLQWIAPSIPRGTGWSRRNYRVTLKNTCDRVDRCVSTSIYFLSRTGIETEVNVTVGFCLGLALAMDLTNAMSSSSWVDIACRTNLSAPFTIRTQDTVWSPNKDGTWTSILFVHNVFKTKPNPSWPRIHPLARIHSSFRGFVYCRH